jgi:hypothetical protein
MENYFHNFIRKCVGKTFYIQRTRFFHFSTKIIDKKNLLINFFVLDFFFRQVQLRLINTNLLSSQLQIIGHRLFQTVNQSSIFASLINLSFCWNSSKRCSNDPATDFDFEFGWFTVGPIRWASLDGSSPTDKSSWNSSNFDFFKLFIYQMLQATWVELFS